MADVRAQLVQAYQWIKEGKKAEAEAHLIRILSQDEGNADAWWLLANALTDPTEQAEALDQLLQLRPGDEKAQKMLAKLRPPKRPAAPPPPPARPTAPVDDDSDPFADVKSTDDDPFAEVGMPRTRHAELPDDDEEDPFAVAAAAQRSQTRMAAKPKRSGGSRLGLILTIIAAVVLVAGGICVFAVIQFQRGMQQVVTEVMSDPTLQAAFNDPTLRAAFQMSSSESTFASDRTPTDTTSRGPLLANQVKSGVVDTFVDDSWIFNADAGASYTIEVIATDRTLDPQLSVYGADNQLIDANDDIDFMENRNSRVTFVATQNGIHTLVISAFGQGGSYEVIVRR